MKMPADVNFKVLKGVLGALSIPLGQKGKNRSKEETNGAESRESE
jgi:hypothetical protein